MVWNDLGPFFAVQSHSAGAAPLPPWFPMSELVEQPGILRDRVHGVRATLAESGGPVEERVAASVMHQGLVARLLSPALAAAAGSGLVLDLSWPHLWWQRELGGGFSLSLQGDHLTTEHDPLLLAELLAENVLDGVLRDLVEATLPFSVSEHILWGNVASALNGAATMIATIRPLWSQASSALVTNLLDLPPLRGSATGVPGRTFRRRSCCLIYRAAPGATGPVCGDCVLLDARSR